MKIGGISLASSLATAVLAVSRTPYLLGLVYLSTQKNYLYSCPHCAAAATNVALTVGCVVHSLMTQLKVQLTAFSVHFLGGLFTRNNHKTIRKRTLSQIPPSPASRHDRLVWATSVAPKGSRAGAPYQSIGTAATIDNLCYAH